MAPDMEIDETSVVGDDAGVSTIEVVLLAPLLVFMMLLIVAFGILTDANGTVSNAASDAARAGSLQRTQTDALAAARTTADADLADTCAGTPDVQLAPDSDNFTAGGLFSITVTCQAKAFGVLGVNADKTITEQAAAPLDPYRRTGQ